MTTHQSLVSLVGNTPLLRLKGPSEKTGCEILGKCEFLNPGQSVKDRAALWIIRDAEERGDQIVFHLECAEEDKGRIIGREGRVVNAMRSLLHVASIRAGVRASLNIE